MEEESNLDDPLILIKPTTSSSSLFNPSISQTSQTTEFNNNLTDEFVDLSEWSGLSDGDLFMSRQLAATIGINSRDEEEEINGREKDEIKKEEKNKKIEEGEINNNLIIKNNWNGFNEHNNKTEMFGSNFDEYSNNGNNSNNVRESDVESEFIYQHLHNHRELTTSSSPSSHLHVSDQSSLDPPPPPIFISPQEVDSLTITLEKNQQCACTDCGKLFNSVWYLKQHAVKHSNDRPFKCRFCMKTYKFRSNLYQHKCPERNRLLVAGEFNMIGHPYRRRAYNRSADKKKQKEQHHRLHILHNQKLNLNDDKQINRVSQQLQQQQSPTNTISINTTTNSMFCSDEFHHSFPSQQQNHHVNQQIYPIEREDNNGLLIMGNELNNKNLINENNNNNNCFASTTATNNNNINFTNKTSLNLNKSNNYFNEFNNGEDKEFKNFNNKIEATENNNNKISSEMLEEYLHRNRHRVFNCRKCKLYFPSQEYFGRHMAYHNELDTYKFHCEKCPERFLTDQELHTHQLQHAEYSPHNCRNCNGVFRSALALRRHKDNWTQCHSPPNGMQHPFFVNPIDQFSFVGSDLINEFTEQSDNDEEELVEDYNQQQSSHFETNDVILTRKTTQDSGYHGSDTQSPAGSHSPPLDDNSGMFASSSHLFDLNQKNSIKNDLTNFEL